VAEKHESAHIQKLETGRLYDPALQSFIARKIPIFSTYPTLSATCQGLILQIKGRKAKMLFFSAVMAKIESYL
jgi:hypothetical protein